MSLVKIVIPLYKETLSAQEKQALANNVNILSAYPITFLKPEGTDVSVVTSGYPQAEMLEVSAEWLGRKRGIAGYNEMMMSKEFYDMFSDYEYILICQTDVWIFRDELMRWCERGYDIVAAPWPTRPRYRHFPLKQLFSLRKAICPNSKSVQRQEKCGKVGNGGLSLRRIASFQAACLRYSDEIEHFMRIKENEDIFWAFVPEDFNYPSEKAALEFSFDNKPALCYRLNGKRLPMGCHGYMHKSRLEFWRRFIDC